MSLTHGPSCGCSFCHTVARLVNLVLDPRRDPRLVQVATTRLRVLHSLLLDLVDGVSFPQELGEGTRLTDRGAPPGTPSQPSPGVPLLESVGLPPPPGVPPLAVPAPVPAVASKWGARPPLPPPPVPPAVPTLPDEGRGKEKKRKNKTPDRGEGEEEKQPKGERKADKKRKRSRSSPRHRRKSDRKSRSTSRTRKSERGSREKVQVKVEPSPKEEEKRSLVEVAEESKEEGAEVASSSKDKRPRPPSHPPPGREPASGSRRPPQSRPVYRARPQYSYYGSEKGVKKKQRNRRFYEERVRNRQDHYQERPRYWGQRRRR